MKVDHVFSSSMLPLIRIHTYPAKPKISLSHGILDVQFIHSLVQSFIHLFVCWFVHAYIR